MKPTRYTHPWPVTAAIAIAALASIATSAPTVPEWSLEDTGAGPGLLVAAGTPAATTEIRLEMAAPSDIWSRRLKIRGMLMNRDLINAATVAVTLSANESPALLSQQTHVLGGGDYVWLELELHGDGAPACQSGSCEERFTLALDAEDTLQSESSIIFAWSATAEITGSGDEEPVGTGIALGFADAAPQEPEASVTPDWYAGGTMASRGVPAPILAVGPEQARDSTGFVVRPAEGVTYAGIWLYGIVYHYEVDDAAPPRLRVRLTPAESEVVAAARSFAIGGTGTVLFALPLHALLACAGASGVCEKPLELSFAVEGGTERSFALYWGILPEVEGEEDTPAEELIEVEFRE